MNFTITALLLHLHLKSRHMDLHVNHYTVPKYHTIDNLMALDKLILYNATKFIA